MEHKTWLWRRRTPEKTNVAGNKSDVTLAREEEQKDEASVVERSFQDLKEQLSSVCAESNAKDDLLAKQTKIAQEAIAGWEKAQGKAESFKQELGDALVQKAAAEVRIANINSSFRECMHQLHVTKEEHQHTLSDAVMKISGEEEKAHGLEKKLAEANSKLAILGVENSNLRRILELKEMLIEDLSNSKSESEVDFSTIVARLDSSEKDNDSLKYEVCMLQKELEIRNQDRDFHLKSADAAHRQYLESVKKITRLESECQKLRIMIRKRLPGPATIARMRNEVEMLGNGVTDTRDFGSENDYVSSKRIASLVERMNVVEDENKILKETLANRSSEVLSLRVMSASTSSKLSRAETQVEELSKGQVSLELARSSPISYDLPLASISEDGGDQDTISCAESWASALISELEHFRNDKPSATPNRTGVSELSLMDDFAEMEKLALVCVDKPSESYNINSGIVTCTTRNLDTESTGKEIVPLNFLSNCSERNNEIQSSRISLDNHPRWLQEILQVIVQKHHSTGRSLDVILEEIGVAMKKETSKKLYPWNSEKPLIKLIELIEGIIRISKNEGNNTPRYGSSSPTGHVARIFVWEISELGSVLQHFLVVCNDLLHRKVDFENFACELASSLDWIINNSFSLQDVSTTKEAIKKLYNGNESFSDSGLEGGITEGVSDASDILSQMEESKTKDENTKLRYDVRNMESMQKGLEERFKSTCTENESLLVRLKEAGERISYLQAELAAIKDIKGLIENQIINQRLITEDAKGKLNVEHQKFSSLEVELEGKSNCCDERETTCLELQLQLERVSAKETPTYDKGQEDKQLREDWQISAVSEKLAECQTTILNLGKQLKALAAPEDAALLNKVISSHIAEDLTSPKTKEIICTERKQQPTSPTCANNPNAGLLYGRRLQTSTSHDANNSREGIGESSPATFVGSLVRVSDESNKQKNEAGVGKLVLVPKRQKGGVSFMRKLLSRRKKDNSKRLALTHGS